MTSALRWGGWSAPRPGRFIPGKDPVPIIQEAQGRSERVRKISPPPPGFDPRTVQPVASRYTDWAIPDHTIIFGNTFKYTVRLCYAAFQIQCVSTTEFCITQMYEIVSLNNEKSVKAAIL